MMEKILELKQKKANITNRIREILDKYNDGSEMSADDKETINTLETEFDSITNEIISLEKKLNLERKLGEQENDVETNNNQNNDTETEMFQNVLSGRMNTKEYMNALQQDDPEQAGYLISPLKFVNDLIEELDNMLFMRKISNVLPRLKNAQSLGYPQRTADADDAVWGTEIEAPTEDTGLKFGRREFKPNPATMMIKISQTLIRNAPGVDKIVRDRFKFKFGELLENAYMNGNGVGRPLGIFTASSDGISTSRDVTCASTTAIVFNDLYDTKYSLKQQYRKECNWVFNRTVLKTLVKLKDGEGQYIWNTGVKGDESDMLMGFPVMESEYAPNTMTAGLYVGMLGNFKHYWIVDSLQMMMKVLNELYALTNQVGYIGRVETDGCPVQEEAFARVKLASS